MDIHLTFKTIRPDILRRGIPNTRANRPEELGPEKNARIGTDERHEGQMIKEKTDARDAERQTGGSE